MSILDGIHTFENKQEVILRITKFCNQNCLFCFTEIDNKTMFLFEEIKLQIDEIIKNKTGKIDFVITGGEPTLNPDFIKIIDYIYKKGHYITIQSNAVGFGNRNLISKLIKYKDRLSFFISFHSHIPKIYDIITNSKNQYEFATKGIKELLSEFDNITINIVLNAFNINYIFNYFEFLGKEFYSINKNLKINISVMSNIYKYNYIDKMLISYDKVVHKLNSIELLVNKYGIKIGSDFGGPCDLPFCIGKKLFYFDEKLLVLREENHEYIDRVKNDNCKKCKYVNNCSGILKLYLKKYGDLEFK